MKEMVSQGVLAIIPSEVSRKIDPKITSVTNYTAETVQSNDDFGSDRQTGLEVTILCSSFKWERDV